MKKPQSLEQQLAEIVRFCREKASKLRATNPMDISLNNRMAHFAHIEDRSGKVYVEVGSDVLLRIQEWCYEHLSRRGWTHLISVSDCAKRVEEAIAFRFFRTPRQVSASQIAKLVHALDKAILEEVKSFRYLWPCYICYGEQPPEFSIGPVRFRPTTKLEGEIDTAIRSWSPQLEEVFRDRVLYYFRSFGWIAEVSVETAEKDAAKRISLLAVQIALTAIKLLLSKGGTESRIRMSEQQNYLLERAELYFTGDEPHLSWLQSGARAPFADSWWEDLNQSDNAKRLAALGRVVSAVIAPVEQTFLKLKYLSALRWFNDASIDTHSGSRIAKFVTVLEALTGCNQRDDLAEAVGERVAYLLAEWPDEGTVVEIKMKVKRIYAVRSELVHGVRDPLGLELGRFAADAAHLAHMTLVAFLDFMIFIGVDRDDYDNGKLLADFAIIGDNVRRMNVDM
jgi:Apea-like HEPN